ncbi:hypothetical protein J6590_057763 [Homalodisca vitripennis]|nr:hypothetical protein J6590_057763 [Homalodisca vitripennis]
MTCYASGTLVLVPLGWTGWEQVTLHDIDLTWSTHPPPFGLLCVRPYAFLSQLLLLPGGGVRTTVLQTDSESATVKTNLSYVTLF